MPSTSTSPSNMLNLGRGFQYVPQTNPSSNLLNQHEQQVAVDNSLVAVDKLDIWLPSDYVGLFNALLASFSVILISELGDKTFIITAIMAMKNSRLLVFLSSATALLLMTILSVGMGVAVTVVPKLYTHYASIVLFLCFGLKMLKEAYDMENESEESEFDEVKRSLEEEEKAEKVNKPASIDAKTREPNLQQNQDIVKTSDTPELVGDSQGASSVSPELLKTVQVAPTIIKVFTMILIAEWGDRSQISTIILAAREDTVGVFVGSLSGHVLCTGLAVIGGHFVANMISARTMTFLGGLIFLLFTTAALVYGPD